MATFGTGTDQPKSSSTRRGGRPEGRPRPAALLLRGVRKRCPVCGRGKAFRSYFKMVERCPVCGYAFEREEGYWVGAIIMNYVFVETWFALLFVTVLVLTLPDPAWVPLLVVAVVTNGLLPVICYPYSKTVWMAVDLYLHPHKASDNAAG